MIPGHVRPFTALALLIPWIPGCETTQPFYDGPPRPRDQVALIPVYSNVRVDQRRGDVIHKYIAILPGRHTAEVIWPAEGASCKLEFTALAGAEYRVTTSESIEPDSANQNEPFLKKKLQATLIQRNPNAIAAECTDIAFVLRSK